MKIISSNHAIHSSSVLSLFPAVEVCHELDPVLVRVEVKGGALSPRGVVAQPVIVLEMREETLNFQRPFRYFWHKVSLMRSIWSSLNIPCTECPLCHPISKLEDFPFLINWKYESEKVGIHLAQGKLNGLHLVQFECSRHWMLPFSSNFEVE